MKYFEDWAMVLWQFHVLVVTLFQLHGPGPQLLLPLETYTAGPGCQCSADIMSTGRIASVAVTGRDHLYLWKHGNAVPSLLAGLQHCTHIRYHSGRKHHRWHSQSQTMKCPWFLVWNWLLAYFFLLGVIPLDADPDFFLRILFVVVSSCFL